MADGAPPCPDTSVAGLGLDASRLGSPCGPCPGGSILTKDPVTVLWCSARCCSMTKTALALVTVLASCALGVGEAQARDWYVSAARGKGKKGTVEKPSKDLGNIAKKLEPGDVVHIAEGTYRGRGKVGSVTLQVPVQIIGGYSDDFKKRDPWGAHRTILSGVNKSRNYTPDPTLFIDLAKYTGANHPILVDGLIVDMGGRNHYATDEEAKLLPKASPAKGTNPSPSLGALVVRAGKSEKFDRGPRWQIAVKNNIVINAYTNQGALSVSGFKGSKISIHNNVVAQHSGHGIFAGSKYAGSSDHPEFKITNNTVVFSWDSSFSQGFNIGFDRYVNALVKANMFAFSDIYAIWNGNRSTGITLVDNVVAGARKGDFLEFNTIISVDLFEDEAEYLGDDTEGNISEPVKLPVSKAFATLYGSRVVVDREKLEADIKATNSDANALRSMLGLPLRAGSVAWPKISVYINRLSVDDAVAIAGAPHAGKYGASPALIK